MSAARIISRFLSTSLSILLLGIQPYSFSFVQKTVSIEINEHLQLARRLQQAGEVIRSASEFREALGLTLEQLGGIYRALNNLEKAELAYKSAVEAKADSDDSLLGLAIVYMRKGEFQKGIDAIQSILAQKPFHRDARHMLGKLYFGMGRNDAAVFELEEAERLAPDDYNIATTLAMAYLKLKRLDNARQIFARMLNNIGSSPRLHIFFGVVYRQADMLDEAVVEFKRAAALDGQYPHVHYYLGLSYLSQQGRNKMPEAIAEFQTELRRDPNDYLTNYLLGLVYLSERRLEESVPLLEKAMSLDPKKPDAPLFLGQALSLLGQDLKAIPILESAIELTPDPSRNHYQISKAHYLLAQSLRRQGKVHEASTHADLAASYKAQEASQSVEVLQSFLKSSSDTPEGFNNALTGPSQPAIIVEPRSLDDSETAKLEEIRRTYVHLVGDTYNQLGLLSAGQSDFKRAARYFDQGVNWDPEVPDIDYNLGLARFRGEQFREAIAPLERARKRQPDRLPIRVLLGLSYFFIDDYARAAQQLGELVDSGINDPQVLFAMGLSLASTGDRARGAQIIRNLLQRYPQVAEVHLAMGRANALAGDYAGADDEFKKALGLNPSLPDAHYFAGLALLKQYKFAEAVDEFRKELGRNPAHAKAHYHLGFGLVSLRHTEDADTEFAEAIRLDQTYVDAYYELGKIRLQQNRIDDAIRLLEKAVQLDRNKSYGYYQLSQAYQKAGRQSAAEDAMSRYRELKAKERGNSP
ncbi:MAG TPA: tetratricopeptide repeat protein [Blastocatellia bacterium]|nr:tetratricopeptide repeat protein [Blastocatellia bacterium]